jgi:hypothetical protein
VPVRVAERVARTAPAQRLVCRMRMR